ncbi:MAG: META domain-containing protein [Gemmatimonadales bacterium]|nr:META domain-containing protein [Gemmatimonadales bacterium]
MRVAPSACTALWLIALAACGPKPPAAEPPAAEPPPASGTASLNNREWILVHLGEMAAPLGAGGRPATIQFDQSNGRAAGFAGCNRYSAGYSLAGETLSFGPAISTKMACADGDELERGFLAMLPAIETYEVSDSALTLSGSGGPLARFRAP